MTTEVMSSERFDGRRAATIMERLQSQAAEFIAAAGSGSPEREVRFSVEARYAHQVWEIEVPLRTDRLDTPEQLDELRQHFHAAHEELFAVRDDAAPIEIVSWRAHARCVLRRKDLIGVRPEPSSRLLAAHRRVYFTGLGHVDASVVMLEAAAVGERLVGPMIIESPVTTVVLDQHTTATRLVSGSLVISPSAHPEHERWLPGDELSTLA